MVEQAINWIIVDNNQWYPIVNATLTLGIRSIALAMRIYHQLGQTRYVSFIVIYVKPLGYTMTRPYVPQRPGGILTPCQAC